MGRWLNQRQEIVEIDDDLFNIVNEIRERFPDYRVKYLDPHKHSDITDAPYVITDDYDNVVLTVWSLDKRVLDTLYQMRDVETLKKKVELDRLAIEAKKKANREAISEPAKDLMLHAFRSPKTTYTFKNSEGEIIKVSDDERQ
jgi:hypothetical protein